MYEFAKFVIPKAMRLIRLIGLFIDAVAPIGEFLLETIEQGSLAEAVLGSAVLPANTIGLGIEPAIAALLVQVPVGQGLLVREIMEQLQQLGYPVNGLKQTESRSILESAPCFVRVYRSVGLRPRTTRTRN